MNIKEIRIKYSMTQQELSDSTGIPLRTLQSWEYGERSCPSYVMKLLKFYLEKTFEK